MSYKQGPYRQGDVFIIKTDEIPSNYQEVERDEESIVLAYGEATGHKHQIKSKNAILVKADNKIFLMVLKPVELIHEEHNKIELPVGNYQIINQRQYTPEGIINVAD